MPVAQKSLFGQLESAKWPDIGDFPHNEETSKSQHVILDDLLSSQHATVVTGFTSLYHLIACFGRESSTFPDRVDVVLGNEPLPKDSAPRSSALVDQMRDYWLEQGVSVSACASTLRLIGRVRSGVVRFRGLDRLHAKLYVGDGHASLGSSNFSRSGLLVQHEVNARFARAGSTCERYNAVKRFAQNYVRMAQPIDDEVTRLLEQLLQAVTWQEALARGASELLEGEWIHRYPDLVSNVGTLWPSQVRGIAQALWMLDTHGSVLVADPTGSGKTRLGVTLLRALLNRMWSQGQGDRARGVVVCPPQVQAAWEGEADQANAYACIVSQGVLSQSRSVRHKRAVESVRRASVLFVDEAHNYLNRQSSRSQQVVTSAADHTILLTATPINKGALDLLRLVELLGLDNLSDEAYDTYCRLRRRRGHLSRADESALKRFVHPFTLRRTKRDLNALVDENPDAYTSRLGLGCRYPVHRSHTYATGETPDDIALAERIAETASQLNGLLFLRTLHIAERKGDPHALVAGRLKAAQALARYNVLAAMRSSRVALFEHVWGTTRAAERYNLAAHKGESGDIVGSLRRMDARVRRGWLPDTDVPDALPSWLRDASHLQEVIERETERYEEIAELGAALSDARQITRIRLLARTVERHPLLIAYDRSPLTLEQLQRMATERGAPFRSLVVTGSTTTTRRKLQSQFALGSETRGVVGLCSDAMSEGVNLQQASAVVFLDAPSVIRLAEQRVGRVDRMDSPHQAIDVYWPSDSPAFSLRASRRFVERYFTVDRILGSNLPLPDELAQDVTAHPEELLPADQLIQAYERRQDDGHDWDGLVDAFQPVRDLVEGDQPLIAPAVYTALRNASAKVLSQVSLVRSQVPWGFFALRGSATRAPRWVLLQAEESPLTSLPAICQTLRDRLTHPVQAQWSDAADAQVEEMLRALQKAERDALPNRKKNALQLMETVLKRYSNDAPSPERRRLLTRLLGTLAEPHFNQPGYDLYEVAQAWSDAVRTVYQSVRETSRSRPVRLTSTTVADALCDAPLSDAQLAGIEKRLTLLPPLDHRVIACVVGVPAAKT